MSDLSQALHGTVVNQPSTVSYLPRAASLAESVANACVQNTQLTAMQQIIAIERLYQHGQCHLLPGVFPVRHAKVTVIRPFIADEFNR